jgi:inhibitor of KinA sporulation pathway (predicted exonuclease)
MTTFCLKESSSSILLKHSGQDARIIQLSIIVYAPTKEKYCGKFDEYVQPPKNVKLEKGASMEVHGIQPNQERMKNAGSIVDVWPRFVNFVESHLENGAKKGITASWGGESCDIEWLFQIAYVKHGGKLTFQSGGVHTSCIQVEL